MKRALLLMVAILACGAMYAQNEQGGGGRGDAGGGGTLPPPGGGTPLTLRAIVDAELDEEMGVINVVFHEDIGVATIVLTSESGAVVMATSFDSSSEWLLELEAPDQSGYYTLRVCATAYEMSCQFWIP